jgi:hypothetical protein
MPSVIDYIKAYEFADMKLKYYFNDIALEADTDINSSIDDDANKESRSKKFGDMIRSILEHILSIIERVMLMISNSLSKVYLTDKGFRKKLMDAFDQHKPRGTIRLIMYQYVDEVLNQQYGKMKNLVLELINKVNVNDIETLKDDHNPLNFNKADLEKHILSSIGAPSNITDMSMYFIHVKELFRGPKKETIIQEREIGYYRNLVDGYTSLKTELDRGKNLILNQAKQMRGKLLQIVDSRTTPDEAKSKIIQHTRNLTVVYNFYSSFVGIMYQLKIEQMLSARIVLQRFYQF